MATLPITEINNHVLAALGEVLWSWEFCKGCATRKSCVFSSCSFSRIPLAKRYFEFYQALVLDYYEGASQGSHVLNIHGDIFKSITYLKAKPDITQAELFVFMNSLGPVLHSPEALSIAVILVVKITTMVDCSALYQSPDRLEKGTSRICWRGDMPFSKYLQDLFRTQSHPIWSSLNPDNDVLLAMKSELRASKLMKHLKLKLRPTHDIRNHLRLDLRRNELEVFHYTSFLKEHLRLTRHEGPATDATTYQCALLPRQLLLETLDSTQQILFPLHDAKSKRLLSSLIMNKKYKFDADTGKFEFGAIRSAGEETISYMYLADRLDELYQAMQNPRPRSWLDKQLQRRSGARYMMLATLVGVVLAVLLGMAALALSAFQTWIAYQAWKHPVSLPES
ncbi:hypothetical protein HD806DRAFT_494619 [Xylariaceae sp. AK1471]|nr:hypothetical protein HD806DRAFT_494619 [Xylariaceae sp. AK1471]